VAEGVRLKHGKSHALERRHALACPGLPWPALACLNFVGKMHHASGFSQHNRRKALYTCTRTLHCKHDLQVVILVRRLCKADLSFLNSKKSIKTLSSSDQLFFYLVRIRIFIKIKVKKDVHLCRK
jgi:hypothetical protein